MLRYAQLLIGLSLACTGLQTYAAQCDGMTVSRALITDRVDNREPGNEVIAVDGHSALFAFTEVRDGNGQTLLHRWYHDDEPVADIRLSIRGDRWRTWSSKNLGLRRDNRWHVEIINEAGCVLEVLSLGNMDLAALEPIKALLAQGLLADAKEQLAALSAQQPDQAQGWQAHMRPRLALASARQEIEEDQLYVARARLEALASRDPALTQQRDQAMEELEARQRALDSDTALKLASRERLASDKPAPCNLIEMELEQWLASDELDALTVMERRDDTDSAQLTLLDSRTGTSHELSLGCLSSPQPDQP